MDLPKFALYTALAVVTYLMLLAWQDDYPPNVGSSDSSAPVAEFSASGFGDVASSDIPNDLPSDLPSSTPAANDQALAASTGIPSTPASSSASSNQLINVITDNFNISIDPVGGDIVYLALPKYLKQLEVAGDPFVILERTAGREYVAQSGLIGANGVDSNGRAKYQVSSTSFEMTESQNTLSVDLLLTTEAGVEVTKRFTFTRNSYLFDVSFIVNNRSSTSWQANPFGQIKRDAFDDPSDAGGFGRTYLGFVSTAAEEDPYIEYEFDDIDDGSSTVDVTGGWMAFSQHYFLTAWIPDPTTLNRFSTRKNNANQYYGEFTAAAFNVEPGSTSTANMQYYAGPKDQYVLAEISENLDLTIDYSFLWFLAAPIYWLLRQIESVIGNYGFSIILLTVVVKSLFYKLSETQYKSMAGMRRLMPKVQQLKEAYGDDKMKLQQASMELYKKEKINPFGGCLPMLVQMPVFIALYWVLLESVELRHAPFIFWLNDLSVRDPFFILPLMMGATMYLQTTLSPAPADPMQAQVMKLMPIMMTVLFLWFPAGLVLYWFTNGALGILQQWYITRKIEAAYEAKKGS
ncbi:MAG: YidC/Oxa1 family membrane protein insertase [Pseudohongiellaceae bacterium]|jgi:YidC/Oxa1 family membrane protein insertase